MRMLATITVALTIGVLTGCGASKPQPWVYDPETVLFDGKPVARLFETLRTGSDRDRLMAAMSMGNVRLGDDKVTMHSGLMNWVIDEDEHCTQRTMVILPHLIRALDDPAPNVREAVVWSIMGMSSHAAPARRRLTELATDPDPSVRSAVVYALESIAK